MDATQGSWRGASAGRGIPRAGFGGVRLTGPGTFGPPSDPAEAVRVVRLARDRGVRLFDTADCYGPEVSERLIAQALHPYGDDEVVATKGGRIALGHDRWRADGRPAHLRAACQGSIRRLRREPIDLYQLNAVDPAVPLEESLGELCRLREEGWVREIGVCNVDVPELARARAAAPIVAVQDCYDLLTRGNEAVVDACARAGIAFLAWFLPSPDRWLDPPPALAAAAARHAAAPEQVAMAWLLWRSPAIVPLPGAATLSRFEEHLAGLDIALGPWEGEALSAATAPG